MAQMGAYYTLPALQELTTRIQQTLITLEWTAQQMIEEGLCGFEGGEVFETPEEFVDHCASRMAFGFMTEAGEEGGPGAIRCCLAFDLMDEEKPVDNQALIDYFNKKAMEFLSLVQSAQAGQGGGNSGLIGLDGGPLS